MKQHTAEFKQELIKMGKNLDSIITYNSTTLHDELYKVTPLFEANLLKSVMKQLEIESSVDIPLETVINYQLGVLVGNSYEYLDYGNYVVYSSEKQEDTDTYKIVCYDKMLYAMKPYEAITGTYPMTIKAYLNALASKIGLTVKDTNFYNYALTIPSDLYKDLEYTYRDVLDEIAQATGSFIIINENDQIEVKYPSISGDTIDEEYLKDVNVKFGEKYGPVNSIVLSRAGESDNVYIQDEDSIEENGLCEVKIVDNQIMNFNNRSDFLQGLLNALNGTEYYLNDFSSIGILYYDVGDYYNITIEDNTYKCLMLNDEINIEAGVQENIHTDMPEQSETDYTKADKTDRRINQTYLIVDKQNQQIEAVIENVGVQDSKIATISATVDELNTKISDIADVTKTAETNFAILEMNDINESEPIYMYVKPTTENISFLYPRDNLYPSDTLYMTTRTIRFFNTDTEEIIDFELIADLLYLDSSNYDYFYLDYESQTCYISKKCGYNADGTVHGSVFLPVQIPIIPYPTIHLEDGDYEISILNYETGYIKATLMASNIYTTQFATKVEVSSEISQTANEIDLSVDQKLTNYSTTNEMNSAINIKAGEITSTVSSTYETKDSAQTKYSQINQTIDGVEIEVGQKYNTNDFTNAKITAKINDGTSNVKINADKINLAGKTINLTSDNMAISSNNFNVDKYGNMSCSSASVNGGNINLTSNDGASGGSTNFNITRNGRYVNLKEYYNRVYLNNETAHVSASMMVGDASSGVSASIGVNGISGSDFAVLSIDDETGSASLSVGGGGSYSYVFPSYVKTPTVIQTSLESEKKNFEKLEEALNIIKNIEIYKYNLKNEDDNTKKHIGFVIGDDYKYSKEVTSNENNGVDIYSFVSVCCKAIQEQQNQIEKLKKEIEKLKEEK